MNDSRQPDGATQSRCAVESWLGSAADEELRAILLTCDGRGKETKTKALEILLNRRFPKGMKDMPASAYLDEEPNTVVRDGPLGGRSL